MNKLLAGDDPALEVLRAQFQEIGPPRRRNTGVGFYLDFTVPAQAPRLSRKRQLTLEDVHGAIEGVEHGVGFILFIRDGAISFLEGFTYDEPWPETIGEYGLMYETAAKRDMEAVRKSLGSA
ncbi:MAG: hypothetical protein ACYTAF_16975 [Planctomycetota bacterium]